MSDLLKGLNDRQLEAVRDTVNQSALVIAGAGSGKTSVLTKRIAYLNELGVDPLNILAVTFTNKASGEMRERIAQLVGEEKTKRLTMGTFHKICILMLKRFGERNGIPKKFAIADPGDQQQIIKDSLNELGLNSDAQTVNLFLGKISDCKNDLFTPTGFYQHLSMHPHNPQDELLYKVYDNYHQRMRKMDMLDFDDLIMESVRLLEASRDTRDYYQSRYSYVMVDEYQDTNPAQYQLIKLISGKEKLVAKYPSNVFVVGDDSQAIYGFRGSDINIILGFQNDFPEARVIKLEQNYRSTKTVVAAGNAIIAHNKKQMQKTLFTANKQGDKIKVVRSFNDKKEAEFVASEIKNLISFGGYKEKDIAILYRTNFLSRGIEEQLIKNRIAYHIVGGVSFYERMEIKDTIAYLKVISNPKDNVAMKRVLGTFPGIGNTTIKAIEEMADSYNLSMVESFKQFKASRANTQNALDSLRQLLQELFMIYRVSLTDNRPDPVSKMMDITWKRTAYKEKLESKKTKETISRLENLAELSRVAEHYEKETDVPTLDDFLESVTLTQASDAEIGNQVSLMTVHASKGLEYPVVFIVGVEEGIFPHRNSSGSDEEVEEERRLMYVALTRAKEECYITYAKTRDVFGGTQWNKPSRFLDEIPDELKYEIY